MLYKLSVRNLAFTLRSPIYGLMASARICSTKYVHAASNYSCQLMQKAPNVPAGRRLRCLTAVWHRPFSFESAEPVIRPESSQKLPKRRRKSVAYSPNTITWVLEHYEAARGCAIPSRSVYERYLVHCKQEKLRPLNDSFFGRLLHYLFRAYGLRARQLRTGKTCKIHYEGLRLRPCSPFNGDGHGDESVKICLASKPAVEPIAWLQTNFEAEADCALPCRAVYDQYRLNCTRNNVRPLSETHFGQLLRHFYGFDKVSWRQFEIGGNLKGYYSGVRCRATSEYADANFFQDAIIPTRWQASENRNSAANQMLSADLSAVSKDLRDAALRYRNLQNAYVALLDGKQGIVPITYNQSFQVPFSVDKGMLSVSIKDLCQMLACNKPYAYAYCSILSSWCDGVVAEDRDDCFFAAYPRLPNINDSLTSFGLRHKLSFYLNTIIRSEAQCALKAFVEAGVINPFERLPVAVKTEVRTISAFLALFKKRYPGLLFERGVSVSLRGGHRRKRFMDLWCEQLKWNLECNERKNRNGKMYKGEYKAEREADIRIAKGGDAEFDSYNPHDQAFSYKAEAERFYGIIEALAHRRGVDLEQRSRQTVPADERGSDDSSESSANLASGAATGALLPHVVTLKILADHRREIRKLQALLRELQATYLLERADNSVRTIRVQHGEGIWNDIDYCIDETVKGLLVFDRRKFCDAIASRSKSRRHLFFNWKIWMGDRLRDCLAPPIRGSSRRSGCPDITTESLTIVGAESLLDYYEGSVPENVPRIRDELLKNGLLCPFSFSELAD